MGSDKKRKRPQDVDPGPARGSGTKNSPATANKKPRPEPLAAASNPEVTKRSTLRASKDEEASFPRGGSSILTPLEFKQISNDATKDVLFETGGLRAKSTKKKPMREGSRRDKKAKGLFGKNVTIPLGDHFCCENDLSVLKRKEKGYLYGETERNRCIQAGPKKDEPKKGEQKGTKAEGLSYKVGLFSSK